MSLVGSLGFTVRVVVMICYILHSTPVFGSNHIQRRSVGTVSSCTCRTTTTTLTCTSQPTGCDAAEKSYGDSCYRFIRDNPRWRGRAHRECVERRSHLVYIESREEQDFLAFYGNLFYQDGRGNDERYWTGLIATSNYIWLDGSPLDRSLFTLHDDTRLGCVFIQGDPSQTVFDVGNCGWNRWFICEFPSSEAEVCQDGERAFIFGGSCYIFFYSPMTQDEAQATCQTSAGGHLLYIESQDELQFIKSLFMHTDLPEEYWIGSMTQHVWLDGSTATYQAFDRNSHNSRGQCFRMHRESNFRWNDRFCGTVYAFVCEREVASPEMQDISGETCLTPVSSLNRLLESGALCLRGVGLPVYFGDYFLCPCGEKDCIKGCGCAVDGSGQSIMCNCGMCDLTFSGKTGGEPYTESAYEEWPVLNSTFLCECSDDVTSTGAEFYRFKDGAFSSLNSTCGENGGGATNTGAIAGGTVAAVLFLLIVVVVVFVVYRKGDSNLICGRKKRVSKSGTAASDNTDERGRYESDFLPPGAHRNPAFAASLDSPEPDDDYGYIKPDTVHPSRQPDVQPGSGTT